MLWCVRTVSIHAVALGLDMADDCLAGGFD
jgi:hypothetical protein